MIVRRKRRVVLDLTDKQFGRGSAVLAGGNGAGKTTCLASIAGLLRWEGDAQVCGVSVSSRKGRRSIAYLPAEPEGLEHLSLTRALDYACGLADVSRNEGQRVARDLDVAELLERPLGDMSSGQRQVSYLALALVQRPPAILLDEPTTGIDAHHRMLVRRIIRQLSQEALVVTATHLTDDISELGDRTIVLHRGTVAFDGSVTELRRTVEDRGGTGGLDSALAAFELGQ